jgi:hypothetical protein
MFGFSCGCRPIGCGGNAEIKGEDEKRMEKLLRSGEIDFSTFTGWNTPELRAGFLLERNNAGISAYSTTAGIAAHDIPASPPAPPPTPDISSCHDYDIDYIPSSPIENLSTVYMYTSVHEALYGTPSQPTVPGVWPQDCINLRAAQGMAVYPTVWRKLYGVSAYKTKTVAVETPPESGESLSRLYRGGKRHSRVQVAKAKFLSPVRQMRARRNSDKSNRIALDGTAALTTGDKDGQDMPGEKGAPAPVSAAAATSRIAGVKVKESQRAALAAAKGRSKSGGGKGWGAMRQLISFKRGASDDTGITGGALAVEQEHNEQGVEEIAAATQNEAAESGNKAAESVVGNEAGSGVGNEALASSSNVITADVAMDGGTADGGDGVAADSAAGGAWGDAGTVEAGGSTAAILQAELAAPRTVVLSAATVTPAVHTYTFDKSLLQWAAVEQTDTADAASEGLGRASNGYIESNGYDLRGSHLIDEEGGTMHVRGGEDG